MTLLSICQGALREVGEFEVPASIVGNANLTAVQMLNLAQREGRELSRRFNWQALVKEYTFTTTASTAGYVLPSDYRYIIGGTWWDRANYWRLFGPASAQIWQELKSGIITDGIRRWFRIRGDSFLLHPTPTVTGDTIAYDYMSNGWCETSAGVAQSAWAADTDVGVLDEELMQMGLVWRFLKAKGLTYADELGAYDREVERAMGRDGGAPTLNMAGSRLEANLAVNVPESGFG